MPLMCKPYSGDVHLIGTQIARALVAIREPIGASDKLTMHGPFPSYVADPKDYARGATQRSTRQTGWRALVSSGDRVVASVSLPHSDSENASIHVRGREPAKALHRALETGLEWLEESNASAELRFISFPSLFITAVWLHCHTPRFIPTRISTQRQTNPPVLTRTELIRCVARAQKVRAKSTYTRAADR